MRLDRSKSHHPTATSESGAAAVEFALILPVLLLIAFGILAFGEFYSKYQVYQGAVREGARAASTRETPAEVRDRVEDAADPYELSALPAISVSGSGGSQCTTSTVGERVTVSWIQEFDISVPFVPTIDADLEIRGVFRCE